MNRTLAIASILVLTALPAAAQAPAEAAGAAPAAAAATVPAPPPVNELAPLEALPPQGYTYNAEGRRDPFVVLLKRGSETSTTTVAARAAGLAGLLTSEVTLRGVLLSQGEHVGMLLGSDDKTYIVRSGDKLADGVIRAITSDALIVLQTVNDPLAQQEQREVRKRLRRGDDGNQ